MILRTYKPFQPNQYLLFLITGSTELRIGDKLMRSRAQGDEDDIFYVEVAGGERATACLTAQNVNEVRNDFFDELFDLEFSDELFR